MANSYEDACKIYQDRIAQLTALDLDILMNDTHRHAGTICWSKEEYANSEHGKANAHVGLFEVHNIPNPKQVPTWWTPIPGKTDPSRPLFGLKVIDLTRIIASPAITRELAELGASVMRITSPNVTDMTVLNADLGWGKWNAHLDLKKEEDRATLRKLIEESDVVVDGYRPGVMEKWGFGKDDILGFFKDKERGIIYARENCYGWYGPWSSRSGWQQISDAVRRFHQNKHLSNVISYPRTAASHMNLEEPWATTSQSPLFFQTLITSTLRAFSIPPPHTQILMTLMKHWSSRFYWHFTSIDRKVRKRWLICRRCEVYESMKRSSQLIVIYI